MRQSFKYRLYPNRAQQQVIEDTLEHCRLLYNRLLAERKESYEKSGKTLSYVAQANSFPARKAAIPVLQSIHSQVLQDVAQQLDKAFHAFFRRVKNGRYYAVFSCEVEVVSLPPSHAMMGGDLGIKHHDVNR